MSSRRRRRGNAPAADEPDEPAPSAAAQAGGNDDDDDDDDDESPATQPITGGRRRLQGRFSRSRSRSRSPTDDSPQGDAATRFERSATRAAMRAQTRLEAAHRPSAFARCCACLRDLCSSASDQYFLSRYQVAASTPLQMTLYFTIPYALVWAVMNQYLFFWKADIWEVPLVVAVVSPMIFWVWALLEPIRLALGYVGNLRERVAWLGGFWILTIFPQLIVHLYFCVAQPFIGWFNLPVETAMSAVYLATLVLQLGIGYRTIKRLIAKAMADFHLQPVEVDEADLAI